MKRRKFLKNTMVATATGVAISTGLLASSNVFANALSADIRKSKSVDEILTILGATDAVSSDMVKIKAPEIAENGAVVPVGITSELPNTTEIISLTAENPTPFAARYTFGEGADTTVKSRFKMGKTTDVVALVKADGKYYTAKTNIKVTKGGCGG